MDSNPFGSSWKYWRWVFVRHGTLMHARRYHGSNVVVLWQAQALGLQKNTWSWNNWQETRAISKISDVFERSFMLKLKSNPITLSQGIRWCGQVKTQVWTTHLCTKSQQKPDSRWRSQARIWDAAEMRHCVTPGWKRMCSQNGSSSHVIVNIMLHDVSWFLYISDSMLFLGSCSMRRVSQSSEFDEAICLWVSFPQTRGQALKECGGFRCSLSKQPMAHGMCGSHKAQWSTQSRSLQASKDPLLAAKVRRWCHLESSGKQYSWSNTPDLRCLG